ALGNVAGFPQECRQNLRAHDAPPRIGSTAFQTRMASKTENVANPTATPMPPRMEKARAVTDDRKISQVARPSATPPPSMSPSVTAPAAALGVSLLTTNSAAAGARPARSSPALPRPRAGV